MSRRRITAACMSVLAGIVITAAALSSTGADGPRTERRTFALLLGGAPGAPIVPGSTENFGDCMSMDGAEMLDRPMSMKSSATVAMTGSGQQVDAFTACMDRVGIRYSPA